MIVGPSWRKPILLLHVASSVGLVGSVGSFLVLAAAGLATSDLSLASAAYLALSVVAWQVIVPLMALALVVGIIQSLVTPWGLLRHYWVVSKLFLTVVAAVVLSLQMGTIDRLADAARNGVLENHSADRMSIAIHAAGGIVVLLMATALSIYKPRGLTALGQRRNVSYPGNSSPISR